MRVDLKLVIKVVLSLIVSGVFIAFSLRQADPSMIAAAVGKAHLEPVLGFAGATLLVHVVKTARWGILLEAVGTVGVRRLNAASAVGFMMMVILPLRLGELARPLLVAQPTRPEEQRLSRSKCLATILVERVVDILAMGVLGVVSLHVLAPKGHNAELARQGAMVITVAFALVCVLLTLAFFMRERALALVQKWFTHISPALARRAVRLLDGFIQGLHLGSLARVVAFLVLTTAYWALNVWSFWILADAYDLEITPMMATTVLAFQVIGIMIPAGPGMVGTSQFFIQLGLSVCLPGIMDNPDSAARAAGYANTLWAMQFGQQVLMGLVFLALGHISFSALFIPWDDSPDAEQPVEGVRVTSSHND